MRLFQGLREPAPKLVPGNATAAYLDLLGMPFQPGDPVIGLDDEYPEWITPEEAARRVAALPPPPPVEELMRDPNVAAVVEAAKGMVPVPEFVEEN